MNKLLLRNYQTISLLILSPCVVFAKYMRMLFVMFFLLFSLGAELRRGRSRFADIVVSNSTFVDCVLRSRTAGGINVALTETSAVPSGTRVAFRLKDSEWERWVSGAFGRVVSKRIDSFITNEHACAKDACILSSTLGGTTPPARLPS